MGEDEGNTQLLPALMTIEAQLESSKSTTCDDYARGRIDTTPDTTQSATLSNDAQALAKKSA
jgi:hypothetical protein